MHSDAHMMSSDLHLVRHKHQNVSRKGQTKRRLREEAVHLCSEGGFDNVTGEDVARAVVRPHTVMTPVLSPTAHVARPVEVPPSQKEAVCAGGLTQTAESSSALNPDGPSESRPSIRCCELGASGADYGDTEGLKTRRLMTIDELETEAMRPAPEARTHLASRLISGLDELSDSEVERMWLEEAVRPDAELDSGSASSSPVEDVIARARARKA